MSRYSSVRGYEAVNLRSTSSGDWANWKRQGWVEESWVCTLWWRDMWKIASVLFDKKSHTHGHAVFLQGGASSTAYGSTDTLSLSWMAGNELGCAGCGSRNVLWAWKDWARLGFWCKDHLTLQWGVSAYSNLWTTQALCLYYTSFLLLPHLLICSPFCF